MDLIIIKGLRIAACVGVPHDEERKNSQNLEVDAVLSPLNSFVDLDDQIVRLWITTPQPGGLLRWPVRVHAT
jgi:hypothetical protein